MGAEDDFWNQEQEGELEQDQADVAQDDYIDEFGNVMEEPEDEEAQQAQEVDMPHREGDLSLDEIPEDQREAVEGNLALKRALSSEGTEAAAKKRKLNGAAPPTVNPTATTLLQQWRLNRDSTAQFVMRVADARMVEKLASSHWKPRPGAKRTNAEQLYEQLLR